MVSKPHILVVEDDPINQRLLRFNLEQLACQSVFASTGLEAVNACQTEVFDLIIMDLDMPEMDGLEATLEIRRLLPKHVPILICSSYQGLVSEQRCQEVGADDFLPKSPSIQDLKTKFQYWLNSTV